MGTRLVAGGAAGITAATLTYPLDLVRTRLAAQVSLFASLGVSVSLPGEVE
jgi:solute carrier family 25 phosphate transporter 23/24/25/41